MHRIWLCAWVLVVGGFAGGCLKHPEAFHCSGDDACDSGRRCIDGACARTDSACASGYRWDDTAGPRKGSCAVAAEDGGIDGGGDSAVDPLCGNGAVDVDEKCDPGTGSTTPCPTVAADCDDQEPCTDDVIIGSGCQRECAHTYEQDHMACETDTGTGVCHKGACCLGCWNGTTCVNGTLTGECGARGADCLDCQQSAGECQGASCVGGACMDSSATLDGQACAGGTCHGGACCQGCWDGAQCVAGNDAMACGSGGSACAGCGGDGCVGGVCAGCTPSCGGKSCGSDNCGGSCGSCADNQYCSGSQVCLCKGTVENTDTLCSDGLDDDCNDKTDCVDSACDGMRCKQANGRFCKGGACITGCRIALASGSDDGQGMIVAAGTSNPVNPCQVCDPARNEQGWSLVAPGTGCKTNGSSGACTTAGVCCAGCIDGAGQCRTGALVGLCGSGGGACASCEDGNPCTEDSCAAGACMHANVSDGTVCESACGSGSACGDLGGLGCSLGAGSCAITQSTCKSGQCQKLNKPTVKCCSGSTAACCAAPSGAFCGNCK